MQKVSWTLSVYLSCHLSSNIGMRLGLHNHLNAPSIAQTPFVEQLILIPPETLVFGAKLYLLAFIFPFFFCEISVLRRPIAAKFCSVIGSVFDYIILVQNFERLFSEKF